ncbi:MAG TPA: ATP-binding protein [Microlunatus sp.]|jgi:PAS domain S-box-containing protein|nr:ATP-binding protein [Microlunatus sp.]
MAGLSRPQDGAPRATTVATGAPQLRLVAVAIVVALGLIGLVLASDLPDVVRRTVGGAGLVISGVALAGSCRYRYHRSTGRRQQAWLLFGCAALGAAAGNLWVTITDLVDADALRVVGDLLLLVSLLLVVVALAIYPSGTRRPVDLVRVVLDGVVLAGSILLILSITLIPRIVEQPTAESFAVVLAPVIDIVLVTVAWLMYLRSTRRDRPALALAAAGFALFAVSDISAAVRRAESGFTFGTVVDLGWIAGYTLLAIAVRWSPSVEEVQEPETPHRRSPIGGTLLMFAVFFAAGSLTLYAMSDGEVSTTAVILLGGVLVAITGRQVLLLVDNDRLRASLEQRVIERSTELAEVTQRTDLLVDSVEDGVYGVDSRGRVTFVNPAGARLLGARRGVLLGEYAHETFHSHPLADCYLRTIQRNGLAITGIDDAYRSSDGRLVPVEVSASPMADPLGERTSVRGVVVVFRDVTRRREVDRMKNEFVSLVSHELKTPLTAIRGSLGLLAGGALGELAPPATRMVEIALESSERLTRLINEILDMERIESGSMAMQIGAHDVASLLAAAQDQVQVLAGGAGIDVDVDVASGQVVADADRVVQTLINLIGNAIKFSPPGSVVTLSAVPDGTVILFTVRDQGRGVPENRLDVIFERFEQVDSSDAREKGGTGLGLSISRSIVERLGGRIWAENNVDGGSTFSFTLPEATAPDQDPLLPTEQS